MTRYELSKFIEVLMRNRGEYYIAYGVEFAAGLPAKERTATAMELIDTYIIQECNKNG